MKRLLTAALLLFSAASLDAQSTTILATTIVGSGGPGGDPIVTGKITWQPADINGNLLNVNLGATHGIMVPRPIVCKIVGGAITTTFTGGACTVVDTSVTNSSGFCYRVTIQDTVSGWIAPVMPCVQPSGSTWSLDTYIPPAAPTAEVVAGPAGPAGPACSTGSGICAMSVPVQLPANPTTSLEAATRQYVDPAFSGSANDSTARSSASSAQTTANAALPANGCTSTAGGNVSCLGTVAAAASVTGPNLSITPDFYGVVDRTGILSSTATLQAAINYGKPIYLSPGIYNVCGLQIPDSMQLVGAANSRQRHTTYGSGSPVELVCSSGDMFVPSSGVTEIDSIGISGLKLLSQTGGGHIFNFGSSVYVVDFHLFDTFLGQANAAKSWITGSGGMQEMSADHVFGTVALGNTVPAIQLDGQINVIDVGHLNFTFLGTTPAPAHYLFELNQISGGTSNAHLHDIVCEQAVAGCINLNAVGVASIDNVSNYDISVPVTAPFITLGAASTSVKIDSVASSYGTAAYPDIVCPAGVCQIENTSVQWVSLGGVLDDSRQMILAHYPNHMTPETVDAASIGLWQTRDGLSGAGVTGNLLIYSDDLSPNGWAPSNGGAGSAPVRVTGQSDPSGGANAVQVTFAIGPGATIGDYSQYIQTLYPSAGTYTVSAWVKSCSGTAVFELNNALLNGQPFTATATWQRFFSSATNSGGTSQVRIGLIGILTPAAGTVCLDIYGLQMTPGTYMHPYVSAQGTAIGMASRIVHNGQPLLYNGQPGLSQWTHLQLTTAGGQWNFSDVGVFSFSLGAPSSGSTQTLNTWFTWPVGTVIEGTIVKPSAACTGPTTTTIQLGDGRGTPTYYSSAPYSITAVSDTGQQTTNSFVLPSWSSPQLYLYFTSTGGNLNSLASSCVVDMWVKTSTMP